VTGGGPGTGTTRAGASGRAVVVVGGGGAARRRAAASAGNPMAIAVAGAAVGETAPPTLYDDDPPRLLTRSISGDARAAERRGLANEAPTSPANRDCAAFPPAPRRPRTLPVLTFVCIGVRAVPTAWRPRATVRGRAAPFARVSLYLGPATHPARHHIANGVHECERCGAEARRYTRTAWVLQVASRFRLPSARHAPHLAAAHNFH